jgi:hypothetical protein
MTFTARRHERCDTLRKELITDQAVLLLPVCTNTL